MAVEYFHMKKKFAQAYCLCLVGFPKGMLCRLNGSESMSAGADAADAAGDMLGFKNRAAPDHPFKKAGRLNDLQLAGLQFAVFDVNHDVAVAFDSGQILDINANVSWFAHVDQSPCICYTYSFY